MAHYQKNELELSRDHRVFDHKILDGIEGLISATGGKLTTFPSLTEEATDLACRKLGISMKCLTAFESLPGGTLKPRPQVKFNFFVAHTPRHASPRTKRLYAIFVLTLFGIRHWFKKIFNWKT